MKSEREILFTLKIIIHHGKGNPYDAFKKSNTNKQMRKVEICFMSWS